MNRQQIRELADIINCDSLQKAFGALNKAYEYRLHKEAEGGDVRGMLEAGNPVLIKGHFIVGHNPQTGMFQDTANNEFPIERTVEAVEVTGPLPDAAPVFAILGRVDWGEAPNDYYRYIADLKLDSVFLPAHSAVFNFIENDSKLKDGIQAETVGANINIYTAQDCIGDMLHEMGHLFWKTVLSYDDKLAFKRFFEKSALGNTVFEFEWEKRDEKEYFCTIYKWLVKSILINGAFLNILAYEEPEAAAYLQGVLEARAEEKLTAGIWEMAHNDLNRFYNAPKNQSGLRLIPKGLADRISGLKVPQAVRATAERLIQGVEYISWGRGVIPVVDGIVQIGNLPEQEDDRPIVYMDIDGVIADFRAGYKQMTGRNADKDDPPVVVLHCSHVPDFFRRLPVLKRGIELYNSLKDDFRVIFLTTPMTSLPACRLDKMAWLKEHVTDNPEVIFSFDKAQYAVGAILIDDMERNLRAWQEAGGCGIDFEKLSNDRILDCVRGAEEGIDVTEHFDSLSDFIQWVLSEEAEENWGKAFNPFGKVKKFLTDSLNRRTFRWVNAEKKVVGKQGKTTWFLFDVQPWIVQLVKQTGINIEGYKHKITSDFIAHVLKKHSDKKSENQRGQIAVKHKDLNNIGRILKNPDFVIAGIKERYTNEPRIILVKNEKNGCILVEEILSGKRNKTLNAKTFWIVKGRLDIGKLKTILQNNNNYDISNIKVANAVAAISTV